MQYEVKIRREISLNQLSWKEKARWMELENLSHKCDWPIVAQNAIITIQEAEYAFYTPFSKYHKVVVDALDKAINQRIKH